MAVLTNGNASDLWLHLKLAARLHELVVTDLEIGFFAGKWDNEILHAQVAFRAADLCPFLVLRQERTEKAG